MEKLRGLYRYETAPGRWWACAEVEDGTRVHMLRDRYEVKLAYPPFIELPLEPRDGDDVRRAG